MSKRSDIHKRGVPQHTHGDYVLVYGSKSAKKSVLRNRSKNIKKRTHGKVRIRLI